MATTHPYISSSGPVVQLLQHLRRSFPSTVDADTLKRLGIAAKNESYLINILRFIGIIDAEGKKTEKASKVFTLHDDQKFRAAFAGLVKDAYSGLFADHGEAAWKLDNNGLITFFRQSDESSDIVGTRQANTFRALSALAGHAEVPEPKPRSSSGQKPRPARTSGKQSPATPKQPAGTQQPPAGNASILAPFGLSVRVEVNLPADANQETYDKIFQSIRKNLIDGK